MSKWTPEVLQPEDPHRGLIHSVFRCGLKTGTGRRRGIPNFVERSLSRGRSSAVEHRDYCRSIANFAPSSIKTIPVTPSMTRLTNGLFMKLTIVATTIE